MFSAKVVSEVVLLDTTQERRQGQGYLSARQGPEKRRIMPATSRSSSTGIRATTNSRTLAGCDLVIEAVFEDRAIRPT